jgi:integrase
MEGEAKEIEIEPSGHWQVITSGGRRVIKAYWTDGEGRKGRVLGPAHVKDSGRQTARGAVVWRALGGTTPDGHLSPRDADRELKRILREAPRVKRLRDDRPTLRQAYEEHVVARRQERQLRRSTVMDYDRMAARLFRDIGADTRIADLTPAKLVEYFTDFQAESPIGKEKWERLKAEGEDVGEVTNECWVAYPPGEKPIEVKTKPEAEEIALARGWTWKHRRAGVYRVTPPNSGRPEAVGPAQALARQKAGWDVERQDRKHWVQRAPAKPHTRNKYRDLLWATFETAIGKGWLEDNPMRSVRRSSRKQERHRVLHREDFYDVDEVARLLEHVDDDVVRAFLLCGFHGGLRLPGEGLGLLWGAVDFQAGVVRPHKGWVRDRLEATKTDTVTPVPMTPRWRNALLALKSRGWRTSDDDHVFAADEASGRPIDAELFRDAFREAAAQAGLKPIPMYNARHSYGTALARDGVDIRTISALMRHQRISTTEIYTAYSPQPDIADRVTRALDGGRPQSVARAMPDATTDGQPVALAALDDEVPPKWLRIVRRALDEASRDGQDWTAALSALEDDIPPRWLREVRRALEADGTQ